MTISATILAEEIELYSGLHHDNHKKKVEINQKERDKLIRDGHALERVQAKKELIQSRIIDIIQALKVFRAKHETQMVVHAEDTVVAESVVSEPVVSEPVVSEPVVSEPVVSEPVVSEPVVSEPVVSEPVVVPVEPIVSRSRKRDQTVVAAPQRAAKAPRWLSSGYKLTRESLDNLRKLPQGPFRERMVRYGFVQ